MKSKTNNIKVRRIGRKRKALPPHTWEAHPTANQGEVNKTLIIAVVTILAIVALAALLFFSEVFVGQAVFMETGLQPDEIGFVLSTEENANVVDVGETVTLPLIANLGEHNISGFNISIGYDNYYFDPASCEDSESTVFGSLNEDFGPYVIEQDVYCDLENDRIRLYYSFIPPIDGSVKLSGEKVLASVSLKAKKPGESVYISINDVEFSESIDGSVIPDTTTWGVDLKLNPVNTPCEKLMQDCYPIGPKNINPAYPNLRCTGGSNGDGDSENNYGTCTSVSCSLSYPAFENHLMARLAENNPGLCDPQEKTGCDDNEVCYPTTYLNYNTLNPNYDYCLDKSIIDAVFNDCNGMESLCMFRELIYGQKCGLNQGDCTNNNQCAGDLTCTGKNEAYAEDVTFCAGEVGEEECTADNQCAAGLKCVEGVCTSVELSCSVVDNPILKVSNQDSSCFKRIAYLNKTVATPIANQNCLGIYGGVPLIQNLAGIISYGKFSGNTVNGNIGFKTLCPEIVSTDSIQNLDLAKACIDNATNEFVLFDNQCTHETEDSCTDEDSDGYCLGSLTTTPAGKSGVNDCNDTNAAVWVNINAYIDTDKDSYGTGTSQPLCTGGTLPPFFANNGDDCNDNNESITVCPAGTTCTNGACVALPIVIAELNCTIDDTCEEGLYCVEELCTNVTKKVILYDADADGDYITTIRAVEEFSADVTVYTILYGNNSKKLVLKSQVIEGGLSAGDYYNATVKYPDTVVKKNVIVYDNVPSQNPTVYGTLEVDYNE